MKKKILLFILFISIFITGCDKKESLVCKNETSDTGSKTSLTLEIRFINGKITSVSEDGLVKFDSTYKKYIKSYKESLDSMYDDEDLNYTSSTNNDEVNFKVTNKDKKIEKMLDKLNIKDKEKGKIRKELEERGYSCK